MKPKETLSNIQVNKADSAKPKRITDNKTNTESPIIENAFDMDDLTKIKKIKEHFRQILEVLGIDLNDDSIKDTPQRVAEMFVNEIFSGLNPANLPEVTLFENKYNYDQMLVQKDINVFSFCEHHFLPIIGKAHLAYFSSGKVIGLSKMNRVVHYFSRRPQVQERLTCQIALELQKMLNTEDVAIVIQASHMCVSIRGAQDTDSWTTTAQYFGKFNDPDVKNEFLNHIGKSL